MTVDQRSRPFQIGDRVRLKARPPELTEFDIGADDVGVVFQVANIVSECDQIAVSFPRTFVPLIASSSYSLVKAVMPGD